jgi:GDPmannose 4,6-dehydratase
MTAQNNIALITGVTGQDGSYLAEELLAEGYLVYGLARRVSVDTTERLKNILSNKKFILLQGDVLDQACLSGYISEYKPSEIYNLAAQSHVGTSFSCPSYSFQASSLGCLNLLEAMRMFVPWARFYQAGSSEQFGTNINENGFQDENTPFRPMSPYACGKVAAHHLVVNYRKAYGLHASVGILFNHCSERRGEDFVTRKITKWIGQLIRGEIPTYSKLVLGNIEAMRDWGHSKEYVHGMRQIVAQEEPDDYVLATGKSYSVKDFLEAAFSEAGLGSWETFVTFSETLMRPSEVPVLNGDSSKAKNKFGWSPKIDGIELAKIMVKSDINA